MRRTNSFGLSNLLFDGEGEADATGGTVMNRCFAKYAEGHVHMGMKAPVMLCPMGCGIACGILIRVHISSSTPEARATWS